MIMVFTQTKKTWLLLLAAFFLVAPGVLLAADNPVTKEFPLKDFDRIQVGSAFTITVSKSDTFKVVVSGEKEKVEDVLAEVKNGELRISFKENTSRVRLGNNTVKVEISLPSLRAASFGGSSSSKINPGFSGTNFVVYTSGVAKSEVHVDSKELFVDVSGSSTLTLVGKASFMKVNVAGLGSLRAYQMPVDDATLDVNGTCSANVLVNKSIKAKATGASTIRYKGNAAISSQEIGSLSSMKKVE
jgi:hypothetical protein